MGMRNFVRHLLGRKAEEKPKVASTMTIPPSSMDVPGQEDDLLSRANYNYREALMQQQYQEALALEATKRSFGQLTAAQLDASARQARRDLMNQLSLKHDEIMLNTMQGLAQGYYDTGLARQMPMREMQSRIKGRGLVPSEERLNAIDSLIE